MRIVVCIRQSADGEINPFDASAYETALRIPDSEVILVSMGPSKTAAFLENLTRLGAQRAVLLTDNSFAGADTLATAYVLSLAIKGLAPDLVICGRQSVDGDTGQVGPSLSVSLGYSLITNVMSVSEENGSFTCITRSGATEKLSLPLLITVEKSLNLRLPRIRSKTKEVEVLNAADLNADLSRCGLEGSPTRVVKVFENDRDRRKCVFVSPDEFINVIDIGLNKATKKTADIDESDVKLQNVWTVGESPTEMASAIAQNITVIPIDTPQIIAERIKSGSPDAVLWGSDDASKAIAPQVASLLNTGLCADCTSLETDGETLYMYRPACSGNVIAKIKCLTKPPMATVRTAQTAPKRIIIGIGYGAKNCIEQIEALAEKLSADIAATRKMVDNDLLPYDIQVGLTGKTVSPDVYVCLGISGAVHHIAGIKQSGTIIAVNSDKNADVFNYADYGIVADIAQIM